MRIRFYLWIPGRSLTSIWKSASLARFAVPRESSHGAGAFGGGQPRIGTTLLILDETVDVPAVAVALRERGLHPVILDLTLDGAALTSGQSVTVRYTRPITSGSASLRDLENNQTPSFGPVTVPVL